MEKIHADAAAKQKAYRERLQARRKQASAGYSDSELARAARDFHISLWQDANDGNALAAQLLDAARVELNLSSAGVVTCQLASNLPESRPVLNQRERKSRR